MLVLLAGSWQAAAGQVLARSQSLDAAESPFFSSVLAQLAGKQQQKKEGEKIGTVTRQALAENGSQKGNRNPFLRSSQSSHSPNYPIPLCLSGHVP